jgi:type IV pilus assembly protein PilW
VPPSYWNHVVALVVCVIVRGSLDGTSLRYTDCDGVSVASPDRRRRRAYSSRVALRNVIGRSGDE